MARRFALWPDLDRVLVRRADSDFITCPTFHWLVPADRKLVRVSLKLANRPSLAGYWKFNTSLLEIRDTRERLETLIKRALVGRLSGISGRDPLSVGLKTSPSNTADSSN